MVIVAAGEKLKESDEWWQSKEGQPPEDERVRDMAVRGHSRVAVARNAHPPFLSGAVVIL